jgi:hypothetical protein
LLEATEHTISAIINTDLTKMFDFLKVPHGSRTHTLEERHLDLKGLKEKLDPIHAELLQVYKELCLNLDDRKMARKLARTIKTIDSHYAYWVFQWKKHATWDDMTEFGELDRPYLALVNQVNQIIKTLR